MKNNQIRMLTLSAVLAASALVLFVVEAQIPPLTAIPGIKLGLANVFTLFALFSLGPGSAFSVLLIRILLGNLITGQAVSFLYSLAGGLLSYLLCVIIRRFFPTGQLWVVSVFSALTHNIGQILAAIALTGVAQIAVYLPVLILAGIITGAFTGLCAQFLLLRLHKVGLVPIYKPKKK